MLDFSLLDHELLEDLSFTVLCRQEYSFRQKDADRWVKKLLAQDQL